jgi:hypothetical protein
MVQPDDELRIRRLAERGYRWVETVERMNASGSLLFEQSETAWAEVADNVHMLIIALQHLHVCISQIQRLGITLDGSVAFKREWRRIRKLRNWLEHEEEYIAGTGKYQDEVEAEWIARGMLEPFTQAWSDIGLLSIDFMAKRYDVEEAIQTALRLWGPLFQLWNPPIEAPQ